VGILILSRMTQEFGLAVQETPGQVHAFPRPKDLAGLEPEALFKIGFSRQKARALLELARAFITRPGEWQAIEGLDNEAAIEELLQLRGIGRWSAEYGLLRGLGRLNVYPGDDVGARNNFAHATAQAISRAPAKNYNPLFLYSDVGLGKTHLCHAIAHCIIERHPELKVIYTTTEEFVAELIDAIQNNSITAFRNRHKMIDVLIIDDVQFLSGKERAQEEFFNVFNAIYQAGKQIVLTSDRPPKDITHLEKRLRSRFGAGIIVDIQPPDLETRIAILRHELKVREREGAIDDEIILYVAEHCESNIRELKGMLNQLLARQDISGQKVDLLTTQHLISQHLAVEA
jgi:hypothetical protein